MPFGQQPARPAPPPAAAAGVANFKRGPAPAARPPVAQASRWAGVQCAKDREPKFDPGRYRVRVLANEITVKPDHTRAETFHGRCEVIEAAPGSTNQPGDKRVFWQPLSTSYANERCKSYMVAAAGYTEVEYDAFDPKGEFMDAVTGAANEYSEAFPQNIVGRLVDVEVRHGNPMLDQKTNQPTGDFWREHSWTVVPEAEQDQTPMPVLP